MRSVCDSDCEYIVIVLCCESRLTGTVLFLNKQLCDESPVNQFELSDDLVGTLG